MTKKIISGNLFHIISAFDRVCKILRPDARIAFAMPPRIGTNSMNVMREGIVRTMRASQH
jgi:hypothetical protein